MDTRFASFISPLLPYLINYSLWNYFFQILEWSRGQSEINMSEIGTVGNRKLLKIRKSEFQLTPDRKFIQLPHIPHKPTRDFPISR